MLNILKKFALEHFSTMEFVDTIVITEEDSLGFSLNRQKVIPFIGNHENHIYISEKGELLVEAESPYRLNKNEMKNKILSFEPELLKEDILDLSEYQLIPIKEEDIFYDLGAVIEDFKSRINSEINHSELKIKELRKGYGFLRGLESYRE